MQKKWMLPSSNSHFRLVWEITSGGEETPNPTPIPTVIQKRWVAIIARQGSGNVTLKGGIHVPEAPQSVFWDTVATVTVSQGSSYVLSLDGKYPYQFYKVEFSPTSGGPFSIFVVITGDAV